jgi:alpha-glucosidase
MDRSNNRTKGIEAYPWWQTAVFYQVYPRSFADGNGDGIGDLQGLISRLDYLKDLGIDAIWLSPHYPSPQIDCGYDIADYCNVNPEYGSLADFQRLLDQVHRRGLRLVTDLVLNHTSDQHHWFQAARSSRENPYRNWYIWHPGINGRPPNNWLSAFGGSAWEFDRLSGEYYYHLFFKEQPDLNWHNPVMKEAMWQIVHFWLNMGVDGFRLDAIDTIFEHPDLPDHPVQTQQSDFRHYLLSASSEQRTEHGDQAQLFQYQVDQPGNIGIIQELRQIVDEYKDRVLIGETDKIEFYGSNLDGVHTIFNFPLMNMKGLRPASVRENQNTRFNNMPPGAWPANTLGNHDRPRTLQAHGDGKHDQSLARVTLAMLLTLRGTPFLYYGEEIGMTNLLLADPANIRDRISLWVYQAALDSGTSPENAIEFAARYGRDQCRTPMQWSNLNNGGFSPKGVSTWLPVNPDYAKGINVMEQEGDPQTLLSYYRALLHLRKKTPALQIGDFQFLNETSDNYLVYQRFHEKIDQRCLVILNFSPDTHHLSFHETQSVLTCLFSQYKEPGETIYLKSLELRPFDVLIGEFKTT